MRRNKNIYSLNHMQFMFFAVGAAVGLAVFTSNENASSWPD